MRQYKKHLKIIGFMTGLMLAALIATNAYPEEFCSSSIEWYDNDMNPTVKIVVSPCEIGEMGEAWALPGVMLNDVVISLSIIDITTHGIKYYAFYYVEDKEKMGDVTLIGILLVNKAYVYRNGEKNNPEVVTEEELKNFLNDLANKKSI